MPRRGRWAGPPSPPPAGVADGAARPCIYVLAGTNGAGKSSLAGAAWERHGADYFNPDAAARLIAARNPGLGQAEANSAAWHQGRRLLERAIVERLTFAFETTLGGATITALLERGLANGLEVRVWYVGLDSPEATVRRRFHTSRLNLIRLLPRLTELRVYDNSAEADPQAGAAPEPLLVLHVARGRIVASGPLAATPAWAKPIVAAAMKTSSA